MLHRLARVLHAGQENSSPGHQPWKILLVLMSAAPRPRSNRAKEASRPGGPENPSDAHVSAALNT